MIDKSGIFKFIPLNGEFDIKKRGFTGVVFINDIGVFNMGFWKEFNRYFVKYGEIALKKTEILAQLAKLKIEIKKRDMGIETIKIEIGDYVINQYDKNEAISDDVIKQKIKEINVFKDGIIELRTRYETVKNQLWETGTENKKEEKSE